MSAAGWRLMGSAGSLADLCAMVVERFYWSQCDALPTADPTVWQVASGKGVSAGLRIRRAGKRYRLERETT
jgi:hypothetical protein